MDICSPTLYGDVKHELLHFSADSAFQSQLILTKLNVNIGLAAMNVSQLKCWRTSLILVFKRWCSKCRLRSRIHAINARLRRDELGRCCKPLMSYLIPISYTSSLLYTDPHTRALFRFPIDRAQFHSLRLAAHNFDLGPDWYRHLISISTTATACRTGGQRQPSEEIETMKRWCVVSHLGAQSDSACVSSVPVFDASVSRKP